MSDLYSQMAAESAPMNPFTDESRDARLKLGIEGLADTLRAPESLHRLVMEHKPATVSVGDFTLKALLDSIIDAKQSHGDYRGIQRLLDTQFGALGDERHPGRAPGRTEVPNGTASAERHRRPA